MSTPDLFDASADAPLVEYVNAFDDWAASARDKRLITFKSSEGAYRDLWEVLVRWCIGQDPVVRIDKLTAEDLQLFLSSRTGSARPDAELSPRYVWRLLHLIDRVLAHRAAVRETEPNAAAKIVLSSREDWQHANAAKRNTLPDYLTAAQAKELVGFLSKLRPRAGRRGAVHTWQELRNRTSVALQLGAGLTPGEIRALMVDSVVVVGGPVGGLPWKLRVPGDGTTPERETPVAQWAAQLLRHWLDVRGQIGIAGVYLFPSTKTGKPWGKVAQYGAATDVLDASGIDKSLVPGGSFRLRHTFALRQLRRGKPPEEVARWLGLVDPAVMARYKRVLSAPVDDVE